MEAKMTFYNIKIISKNKNSLLKYFWFLYKMFFVHYSLIIEYFQKQTKKSFFTLLKSPHVNKTAQEQFEIRFFSKQLNIYSLYKLKYVTFLKKMQTKLFSDVNCKIKIITNKQIKNIKIFNAFNLDNYQINFYNNKITLTYFKQKYNMFKIQQIKQKKKAIKTIQFDGNNEKLRKSLGILEVFGELQN